MMEQFGQAPWLIQAIFIGRVSDFNYSPRNRYDLKVTCKDNFLYVTCKGHKDCAYSLKGFLRNWKVQL